MIDTLNFCECVKRTSRKIPFIKSRNHFTYVLLSVLLVTSIVVSILTSSLSFVQGAKPVGPNPAQIFWPSGTTWGTNLRFENHDNSTNQSVSEIWWGVGTSGGTAPAPPDPPAGIVVEFLAPDYDVSGITYSTEIKAAAVEPASYFWQVQFRKVTNQSPKGGTVSSTMENADTRFVPQDFSVVLENTNLGVHINFRAGSGIVTGPNIRTNPILAGLYVDNAVNIQSIENLDPLEGAYGDNLRLRVTVKNTGRYTDNYTVSAGGSLDSTILNLAPGNTDNIVVTTAYPSDTGSIIITAAGNYARDEDYITATGNLGVRGVRVVSILPTLQSGANGATLTYTVTVKNTGNLSDTYDLTFGDNAGWSPNVSPTLLSVAAFENKNATLSLTVPVHAIGGTVDNAWVQAKSENDAGVFDNKSCKATVNVARKCWRLDLAEFEERF